MKSKIILIISTIGLTLGGFINAFGSNGYMATFNRANGNTTYGCNVCHTSAPALNRFGTDWQRLRGGNSTSTYNYSVATNTVLANLDSDGDNFTNVTEIQAKTNPGDPVSYPSSPPPVADTTPPTVTGFTISASAGSLTVSITTFSATDNVGVTGYLVNESATKPLATAAGWSASVPAGYSFTTTGPKTLYAWAKDAAGNVSSSVSQTVTISPGGSAVDVESPEVMEFTLPLTSTSLTVPILAFRAIDNVAPTAYLITTSPAAPSASATGWRATPPTSYTFTSGGAKTLYGWARDAAGNISESVWDNVDITVTRDQTPPVVTSFRIPGTSSSLTVRILQFTATDNTAVAGYLVTTSSTKPLGSDSRWASTPPATFTFTSGGTKRLYPWAKDAAGNVSSLYQSATVTITASDGESD